jgi:HAD superfamily hydrolase (TIGR01450 family)
MAPGSPFEFLFELSTIRRMRFSDFDAVFFDMDGTLYREHHALAGGAEVVRHLLSIDKPHACVTNNSANTTSELSNRLAKMGVIVPPGRIYTACNAMADWIRALNLPGAGRRPHVFNFAGNALPVELANEAVFVESVEQHCDAVAVGTHVRENATGFDFERSLVGLNLLKKGATLLVGCADRVFPIHGGGVEFGSGSWGRLFSFGANQPAEKIVHAGKPEPAFFRSLCKRYGVEPGRCAIIGDNLESDIQGGLGVGMKTALLMTGITTPRDLAASRITPDVVFEDMPALLKAMR